MDPLHFLNFLTGCCLFYNAASAAAYSYGAVVSAAFVVFVTVSHNDDGHLDNFHDDHYIIMFD